MLFTGCPCCLTCEPAQACIGRCGPASWGPYCAASDLHTELEAVLHSSCQLSTLAFQFLDFAAFLQGFFEYRGLLNEFVKWLVLGLESWLSLSLFLHMHAAVPRPSCMCIMVPAHHPRSHCLMSSMDVILANQVCRLHCMHASLFCWLTGAEQQQVLTFCNSDEVGSGVIGPSDSAAHSLHSFRAAWSLSSLLLDASSSGARAWSLPSNWTELLKFTDCSRHRR